MPESTPPTPVRRRSAGQIAAIIAGSLAGVLALVVIAVGGALLYGDGQKDHDGYLSTGSDRYHTKTYAIATDNLDVETGGASRLVSHDLFGKVRVSAHSRDGKPVFVGIARTVDVDRYLASTAHATLTDVDYDPFDPTYRTEGGRRRPALPATQTFWDAKATGDGRQTLTWDVEDGDWSVVVMNADGSTGVDASVSAGAELPWLDEAGWVSIGAGLLILAVAGGLVYVGVRRPRDERRPAAVAPAAA
jgi:hypothetical protein